MKYLKTYESFKVIAEEEFDELERFIEQVATLIPGASKVNVHKMIYKDSDLSSINFNFSGSNGNSQWDYFDYLAVNDLLDLFLGAIS